MNTTEANTCCSTTGQKFVFVDTGKIKAPVLPERYKKLFLNKQIVCDATKCTYVSDSLTGHVQVCMEYQDITPANEREIFQVRCIATQSVHA